MHNKSIIIIAILCAINISWCLTQKLQYPIYYAEDICNETITMGTEPGNSSFVVKLTKNSQSKLITYCMVAVRLSTGTDHRVHVNTKHVIDAYKKINANSRNTITVTELSDGRHVDIEFNGLGDDIELVVTTYLEIDDDEKCPKHYFLCDINKCIHEIYRCDSYVNCLSDESDIECAYDITPNETMLITIILAIVGSLFGTTCLLSSYLYLTYYRKRESLLDSKQLNYGTINNSLSPVQSCQHSFTIIK
ncbi:unnamed protein product [Medioppia subpectinata]|uniref:Uncharacterized protein n=1 Tax=Medioppia subpectinata TaxID=1979941 RepID=A0A7R9KPR9_9ACAR|nr:unnamed protein product [Medioppia subpectinata]CAG2107425.1 unnamed protein product [Medioppia subpectinata]